MTHRAEAFKISSAADAAHVRTALARLTRAADLPLVARLRFLTAVTAQLRQCLSEGGVWELLLDAPQAALDGAGRLEVTVRPAASLPHGPPPWQLQVARPSPCPLSLSLLCDLRPAGTDDTALAEALLAADEDTAAVLGGLREQEDLVRFHREELYQTNQGVLALHAELDAAAFLQRDLLRAEQSARAEAESARRLLTFLTDASAALSASLDHEDILHRLPGLLVPAYADQVDIWLFDDDPGPRTIPRPAAAVVAARSGRPQHAAAHPGGLPGIDDHPPSALAPDRPLLCIPLAAHRPLGVLTLTAHGARFDLDTSVMLVELARRVGIALDNARRYEQHRDIAEALQRAQLTDLPTQDGLFLAARYLPATHGLNIGGDWYDAFSQPDGSLLVVVGDVTGHGLRAAVIMGQLRTALRAYAVEGDSPGRILTRLHHLVRHQQPDLYATAVIVRFRPGDPAVVWAAAGHPPPVLREPDGAVHVMDTRPGIMLGVPVSYDYQDHTLLLPAGSTLALYTDGLVERRALGIDPGIQRLAHALSVLSTTQLEHDLDGCSEALLEPLLHGSERDDDVCLLLCRTGITAPSKADTSTASTGTEHRSRQPSRPRPTAR
ncbi:PP2C family protein-serine/threonine phosphatase [Streptomyces sp. NPDC002328]|uniref:PP2C family protein-serine/threonine phosphatase n=1 Tax=Streptomyces sp. NPDC002328 TaxID=3364642 RepID=UPI00367AE6A1